MTVRRHTILLITTLLAISAPSLAATEGEVIRNGIDVDGKLVPLPVGEWKLVSQTVSQSGALNSLTMFRLSGDAVTAAALVQTAGAGSSTAWGKAPACERSDLPLARVRYASDHDGSCAWTALVNRGAPKPASTADSTLDPSWLAALATAENNRWRMPSSWSVVGLRVSDPRDAIQIRYAFAIKDNFAQPPDQAWVDIAWEQVELGFRRRIDGSTPLPDWQGPRPAAAMATPANGDTDTLIGRAVWKTVTFRTIVTTLDFSSNYVALGNAASAAALSAFGFVIGPFVYLGHEMAWSYFGEAMPVDLPGLGAEGSS
ncbi:DUF2061 domain-containing protein [Azospirillum melinis]